jgi:hypothetical protein
MEKLQVRGFVKFAEYYLEQLLSRKLVALFTDYDHAKKDILMEAANRWPDQTEGINRSVEILEREADLQDYWDQLGRNN